VSEGDGARILVVDDDALIRQLLRVNLELEGYEVAEASDGEEAIQQARVLCPALVLLDIMMPKLDGWEVARVLRGDPETAGIPVVFLSARAQESDVRKGMELGVADYITKPFDPDDLLVCVQRVLSAHARPSG